MFSRILDEVWDFFEYLAHKTWEYDNARVAFSYLIPDLCVMHATPLDKSQFGVTSYEHSHTPCVPISCDYYDSFYYDVDTCPLLGRPHRLGSLVV